MQRLAPQADSSRVPVSHHAHRSAPHPGPAVPYRPGGGVPRVAQRERYETAPVLHRVKVLPTLSVALSPVFGGVSAPVHPLPGKGCREARSPP